MKALFVRERNEKESRYPLSIALGTDDPILVIYFLAIGKGGKNTKKGFSRPIKRGI